MPPREMQPPSPTGRAFALGGRSPARSSQGLLLARLEPLMKGGGAIEDRGSRARPGRTDPLHAPISQCSNGDTKLTGELSLAQILGQK